MLVVIGCQRESDKAKNRGEVVVWVCGGGKDRGGGGEVKGGLSTWWHEVKRETRFCELLQERKPFNICFSLNRC